MRYFSAKHLVVALILSVFLSILNPVSYAAAAETYMSLARKYYYGNGVEKNMRKALSLYLKAAEKGNVDAMFIAGGMYMRGFGTDVNRAEAFKWLYNAAINGRSSKESERILAEFFMTGQNAPQNYDEALHWYEKAAERGDIEAQNELGFLYFTGNLVEKDYEKARDWFETAARNGYPLAQYNMGILWYTGNGVETVNMVKAYAWFSLAASHGHSSGEVARHFLETRLSPDELIEAQSISTELYKKIKRLKE